MKSTEDLPNAKINLLIFLNSNIRAKGFLYLKKDIEKDGLEYTLHELDFDGKSVRFM